MNFFKERYKIHSSVSDYVEKTIYFEMRVSKFLYIIFYILNTMIALTALAGTIITTLVISRMIWFIFPTWFFFVTASVSAVTTFLAAIINFFLIRKLASDYEEKAVAIDEEITLYKLCIGEYEKCEKKEKDIILFDKIFVIRNKDDYHIQKMQRRLKYDEENVTRRNQNDS